MSNEIRVMLCDDSAIMLRLIKKSLEIEPRLQIVCEAKHGREALEKLDQARPDIVVMDVEMPVMDGVEAVRQIRKRHRSLPIVMFSSLTSRGAAATLDAIAAGATDFATKPAGSGHIQKAMEALHRDLVPKLLQYGGIGKKSPAPTKPAARPAEARVTKFKPTNVTPAEAKPNPMDKLRSGKKPQRSPSSILGGVARPAPNHAATGAASGNGGGANKGRGGPVKAIAIGVSTGGPQALAKFFTALPKPLSVPIVVTQHMPPVFTQLLAERLSLQTGHAVHEAADGDNVVPGKVLIAPGDHHMLIRREGTSLKACLSQDPPRNSCRPSVDPMFESMATCFGKNLLGLVFTGMGQDGAEGVKRLKACGARVFIQDKASSVVWGMPGEVAKLGLADRVIPIDQMGMEVSRLITQSHAAPALSH